VLNCVFSGSQSLGATVEGVEFRVERERILVAVFGSSPCPLFPEARPGLDGRKGKVHAPPQRAPAPGTLPVWGPAKPVRSWCTKLSTWAVRIGKR
jgi:hypothetical protein